MPAKKDDRTWMEEHFKALQGVADKVGNIHPDVLENGAPWAVLKHMAVRNLLGMYLGIISKQAWVKQRFYIDTNSSCGLNLLRDTKFKVAGSALIGATTETPFDHYFFIEPDPVKRAALEARLAHLLPAGKFSVYRRGADEDLPDIMGRIPRHDAHYFAVVDPYGLSGITWKGLNAVMGHPRGDVLINFQTTHVKRGRRDQAEAFFGSPEVLGLIDRGAPEDEIRDHFLERVHTCRQVTETIRVMSGGRNRYYYDLVYAVARTGGDNPWFAKVLPPLKRRVENLTGEGVINILTSNRIDRFFSDGDGSDQ